MAGRRSPDGRLGRRDDQWRQKCLKEERKFVVLCRPCLPILCPVSQAVELGGRIGHGKLKRGSRGEGDQLHRDETQASVMERDQRRWTRNEWTVTMARRAVHRAGGTEDKNWIVGDVERRRSDRQHHVSTSQPAHGILVVERGSYPFTSSR